MKDQNKYALVSVSDKTDVVKLAQCLVAHGYTVLSTGGTYRTLEQNGVPCRSVSEFTSSPEILDGRVKTLHPKIHAGLLAKRNAAHEAEMKKHALSYIDICVVNLYPFEQTVAAGRSEEEIIENIDIGGPTMLRAAAKNFEYVSCLTSPSQYDEAIEALENGGITPALRRKWAREAFAHMAHYDALIARYFAEDEGLYVFSDSALPLRYGENPHQKARFYRTSGAFSEAQVLHGKALSYNNYMDADACWAMARAFDKPAAVIVKHANPCGMATGHDLNEAFARALACDPVSAFGGIIAVNGTVDETLARRMTEGFVEVIMAYDFTPQALAQLMQKKNLRLLKMPTAHSVAPMFRTVDGGILVQDQDDQPDDTESFEVVTRNKPTAEQWTDLLFAWTAVRYVKSNAIVVAKDQATIGIGAGQMNRVGACRIALESAGEKAKGAVIGSDAFFPFRDAIDIASRAGITAIIQPGGSVRDEEVIRACEEHQIAMVITHKRHFRH